MSEGNGHGFLVARMGVPRSAPEEVGQLVATFPLLDPRPTQADAREHEHVHPVDALGPIEAATRARIMAENAEAFGVPPPWDRDEQAIDAAMLLTWAKDKANPCRQIPGEKLVCECLRGDSAGQRALLRSFVAEGQKWIVTSGYKIGNDEVGRVRVPPLAEPIPIESPAHVTNLLAVCEHCLRGVLAQPRPGGLVALTRLDSPTFGMLAP